MSSRLILDTEIDLLKNNVDELKNENKELYSTIVTTKSEIDTLELTLSKEISRAEELSSIITQQKKDYKKELHELNETLVCFIHFFYIYLVYHIHHFVF